MHNKDPLIGNMIDDYKIEDLLGHGGMARVYRALDVKLNRYAALKVMSQPTKKIVDYEKRFYREAQAIAKLKHPNIVAIYRFNDTDNIYYMAMEYVDGADLRWILRDYAADGELIDYTTLLNIIENISKALDYAHKNGVIHRDIKPSNIMISRTGQAVLTDFGLALNVQDGTGGEIFGSPHYIAPEQAVNSAQSVAQTDFYSLGVILYEMLTGSVPYDVGSAIQIAMAHIGDTLPDPLTINPDLHPAFIPILEKTLAKEPKDRYENGAKLVLALKNAIRQARQAKSEPGQSSLNKPIDRIAQHLSPLPKPVKSSVTKPATMMAKDNFEEAKLQNKALMPATIDIPSRVQRANQAVVDATQENITPLIVVAILALMLIGFVIFQNFFRESVPEETAVTETVVQQTVNAIIEGDVSAVEFGEGYITMTIYGVDVQVSREHPLYNLVEVDDSVLIEGHTIQIEDVLRFDNILRAEHEGREIEIADDIE